MGGKKVSKIRGNLSPGGKILTRSVKKHHVDTDGTGVKIQICISDTGGGTNWGIGAIGSKQIRTGLAKAWEY